MRIDSSDQAVAAGPFRWSHPPKVDVVDWQSTYESDYLHATCIDAHRRLVHHRRIVLLKREKLILIYDQVEGEPAGILSNNSGTRVRPPGLWLRVYFESARARCSRFPKMSNTSYRKVASTDGTRRFLGKNRMRSLFVYFGTRLCPRVSGLY